MVSNFENHVFHKVVLNIHLLNYSHFWGQRYCTYCTPEDAKMPYLCIDQLMQFLILTFTPSDAMLYPY